MPTVIIIENADKPISKKTKKKIFNRYKDFKFETITDDTVAYKRTLTNRFDLAFIDVNFCGDRFDAFDIVRGCVLSGKPVVIIRHRSKNCDFDCSKCRKLKCDNKCSVIETCHVTTWNEFQSIEEVTSDCPISNHISLKQIFDELARKEQAVI